MIDNKEKQDVEKIIENMSKNLKLDKINADRIEIDLGDKRLEDGITNYKRKIMNSEIIRFNKLFLNECILEVYYNKSLEYRCIINKSEKGILLMAHIFAADVGIAGTYYFEDGRLVHVPTSKSRVAIQHITQDTQYDSEAYIINMLVDFLAIVAYVSELANSDRDIVYTSTIARPTASNPKKKKSKGAKRQKVNLIKKYTVRTDRITKEDNDNLQKREYAKPTHSFNVGGHWRTYRDKETGQVKKRIWIEGYTKGKGEFSSKTYIIKDK